ncbi:MAG: two-component regulator propeller domain-containing protein [Myxococcota bacterium]|nr:two-component regulator propeller domain-containing protein [Myxococcota bacterium]
MKHTFLIVMCWWSMSMSMARAATDCHVPDGSIRAQVRWSGQTVVIRDGALEIGARRWTACNGLPSPFPTSLATDQRRLMVGFRNGMIARFDGQTVHVVDRLPDRRAVRALAIWRDTLVVGSSSGLFTYWEGRLTRSRHWVLGRREITALAVDKRAQLHIAAGPYGWWRKTNQEQARRYRRGFFGCFKADGLGLRGQPPGRACELPRASRMSGLPSAHVSMMARHRGRLYVGHFDHGLARYVAHARFEVLSSCPRFINALISDGRTLWIGTARGLFKTDDGQLVEPAGIRLPSDHVNGLALGPAGTLWVATSRGIAGIDPSGVRLLDQRHGLPDRIVYTVAVDSVGRLWAGTARGLVLFDPAAPKTFSQVDGTLPHDWVTALTPDGACMFVGTYDAGVVRVCSSGVSQRPFGGRRVWVNPHGLIPWGEKTFIATLGDGLFLLNRHGHAQLISGLPSADVTSVVEAHGKLWIGTRGGLVSRPKVPL